MKLHTAALIGLLGLGVAGGVAYTPVAEARTFVDIDVGVAPPAPRYENVVVRPGYVWAPGYYRWNGTTHVWFPGSYMRERPGWRWEAARWERGDHGYRFYGGHWVR